MTSGNVLRIFLCLSTFLRVQSASVQRHSPVHVLKERSWRGEGERTLARSSGNGTTSWPDLAPSEEVIRPSPKSFPLVPAAKPPNQDIIIAPQLNKIHDLRKSEKPCFWNIRNPEQPDQDLHPVGSNFTCGVDYQGKNVCHCVYWERSLLVAMCNKTGLQYVPKFPGRSVSYLMFYGNGLRFINGSDFFSGVPDLCRVDLDHNQIISLANDTFKLLPNLEVLRLSYNVFLDISKNIHSIFPVQSLCILDISNTYFGTFPNTTFIEYPMKKLEKIFVHHAAMRIWNLNLFQPLTSLQYLGMMSNDLTSVDKITTLNSMNLTYVNLAQNDIYDFPETCRNSSGSGPPISIFPHLGYLDLSGNRMYKLPSQICLPRLTYLTLKYNPIMRFSTDMFNETMFPSLQKLFIDRMSPIKSIQAYALNNSKLQLLSIMYNNIDFSSGGMVDDAAFRGLTGLLTLQLEHNYGLIEGRLAQLFWDSTNLQNLQLGNTFMDTITPDTFSRFPNLVNLSLYYNPIVSLSPASFDGLLDLKFLDLSSCWIVTLSPDHFSAATRDRLTHLDLSGNTFLCDCDLMWLRDWLSQNESRLGVFSNSYTSYQCHNPLSLRGTNVTDFRLQQQSCLISRMAATLIIVVVALLILLSVTFTGLYRFRWHMRLFLYEAFRGKSHRLMLPANNFRYDLFVSYAQEDLPWVRKHLLTKLERNLGLRLCLHQRDFMPGQNIVDNIYSSVQNSRKLLMVFSRAFAHSQWCQFELAMCLQHVIDNDDTLVIVSLDDVTLVGCSELTTTMMAVLLTTTYIQWAEGDGHAIRSFWARLGIALTEVLHGLAPTANINSSP